MDVRCVAVPNRQVGNTTRRTIKEPEIIAIDGLVSPRSLRLSLCRPMRYKFEAHQSERSLSSQVKSKFHVSNKFISNQ